MKIKGESDVGPCFFLPPLGRTGVRGRLGGWGGRRPAGQEKSEGDREFGCKHRRAPTCAVDGLAVFVYGRAVRFCRCPWALALGISLLGCGPVEYLSQVSSRAASTLARAKQEGAEQAAPYEYAKAAEYYHKAREDAGHSYYQSAVDWGQRSEDCSRKAIERARHPHPTGAAAPTGHTTCGDP